MEVKQIVANDTKTVVVDKTDSKGRIQGHRIEFNSSAINQKQLAQSIMDVLVSSILSSGNFQ